MLGGHMVDFPVLCQDGERTGPFSPFIIHGNDVFQVAEAVRDMAWRQRIKGKLTSVGRQLFEAGLMLLAGEVAAARGIDFEDAENQVKSRLTESMSSAAA